MKLFLYAFVFLSLFILPSEEVSAQAYSSDKKAQNAFKKAESFLSLQRKNEAIEQLKIAVNIDTTFAFAMQQLADLYRADNKYKESIPLYLKVLKLSPNLTKLTYFGIGEALLRDGQYETALKYLNEYAKGNLTPKGQLITNKYIQDCEFALDQKLDSIFKLQKLPNEINTSDNEYFPKLTADNRKIIFTRKSNNLENFYESTFSNNKWSASKKIIGEVNSELFNEGAHCISPDGKYLFFTGCNRPEGFGSCDIYVSKLENSTWGSPINLGGAINSKYWESQPAISADGRTLYFVSNRPGGFGGYDIWKSELDQNHHWTPAKNIGEEINTIFDEGSPFIHADNKTLYFASNGWPGFGQQDLYLSRLNNQNIWSTPLNLGNPINNHYQQNSIQITIDGNIGFLSSQDSTDQLDIYTFTIPPEIKPNSVAFISGTIADKETKETLLASISVTNTLTNEIVFKTQSDHSDGAFLATLAIGNNYALHIQKQGYLFYSEQYDLLPQQLSNKEFYKEIYLEPIKKGNIIQLNNLYFDIDKYDLLKDSYTELNILTEFLKTNPSVKIQIIGHTDNTGDPQKNQILSENRAKSVQQFLLEHKITSSRISISGKGDNEPIADNSTAQGRKLNRRTEIKIL